MPDNLIDLVALGLFASDGRKHAERGVSLEQSWALSPDVHTMYREKALVFIKVVGTQLVQLADAQIATLDQERGRGTLE